MKKAIRTIATVLACSILLVFTACGNSGNADSSDSESKTSSSPSPGSVNSGSSSGKSSGVSASESAADSNSDSGDNSGQEVAESNGGTQAESQGSSDSNSTGVIPTLPDATIKMTCVNVDSEVSIAKKIISGFNEQYPNITVQLEPISGEYDTKIITQAASDNVADVISIFSYMLRTYASSKVLLPLNDTLPQFGFDESNYVSSVMAISKGDDGQIYMIPREYSHIVVAVNKTILESENIAMPGNDWDYNQFLSICKQVKKTDSSGNIIQYGVDGGHSSEDIWGAFVLGFGGNFYNTSAGQLTMSDSNAVKGLEALFSLVTEGYSTNDYDDKTDAGGFMAGTSAFCFCSRPSFTQINSSFKKLGMEWDVLPMFSMPSQRAVGFGTVGYGVTQDSKYPLQATALVQYIATQAGQEKLVETGAVIPVLKSLQEANTWQDYPVPGKNSLAFTYKLEDDISMPIYRCIDSQKYLEFKSAFQDYQLKIFNKEISVSDAMKALDTLTNG